MAVFKYKFIKYVFKYIRVFKNALSNTFQILYLNTAFKYYTVNVIQCI